MSDKKDGGPAFPRPHVPATVTDMGNWQHHTPFVPAQAGMTLRDYFAAKAMQGYIVANASEAAHMGSSKWVPLFAESAYQMAGAMLAERDK